MARVATFFQENKSYQTRGDTKEFFHFLTKCQKPDFYKLLSTIYTNSLVNATFDSGKKSC